MPIFRYQYKIAVSYIVVIMLMLILLNTYPIVTSQNFVYRSKHNSMQTRALLIASTLAGMDRLSAEQVSNIMSMLDD
ncbi:MAG: hypothetical protein FWH06_02300 [Oscillospiraceae bacterium]|nr:hypothetical protein [Oscillospiraceae bacterium]